MINATTNRKPNPPEVCDRTWKIKKGNTFEGKILLKDGVKNFNQGKFFLPNDLTMVTIHADSAGKLSIVAYTYSFHVRNDTLHIYGIYFQQVPVEPQMLPMMHIDEWWVKQQPDKM